MKYEIHWQTRTAAGHSKPLPDYETAQRIADRANARAECPGEPLPIFWWVVVVREQCPLCTGQRLIIDRFNHSLWQTCGLCGGRGWI